METNRRKELTIAHGVGVARHVSRSKMGCVILKDNVLEGNKLGCELDHISQLQKKLASKMTLEQEYISRKQRRTLCARVYSEPNLLRKTEHLPPISSDSSLVCPASDVDRIESADEQIQDHSVQKRQLINPAGKAAPKSRKLSEEVDMKHFHQQLDRVKSTDSNSCLPALVSPRLLRRRILGPAMSSQPSSRDSTKDPRFSKLMESLVPSPDREGSECDSNSGSDVSHASPRPSTPYPLLHAQMQALI